MNGKHAAAGLMSGLQRYKSGGPDGKSGEKA